MQTEMDAILDGASPLTASVPGIRHHLEKISRMPFINIGVQFVVNEVILSNPAAFHHHLTNHGGEPGKDMLDHTQAPKSCLHGLHKAGTHETRIEGTHGGSFTFQAHAFIGSQCLQEVQEGAVMSQCRIKRYDPAFLAAMLFHKIVDQTPSQCRARHSRREGGHGP